MRAKKDLLLVTSKWTHLGGHSGFALFAGQLAAHFDVTLVQPNRYDRCLLLWRRIKSLFLEKVFGRTSTSTWNPFHSRVGMLLEIAARRQLKQGRFDYFLFEALEDHFNDFSRGDGPIGATKIIAVSHQPPGWWRLYGVAPSVVQRIDLLMTLSDAAAAFMRQTFHHPNVLSARHGVDAEFFTPQPKTFHTGPAQLVFSGNWLRDYRLLTETILLLAQTDLDVIFHLAIPKFARHLHTHYELARLDRVRWYADLSDEQLRDLYRQADLMFLPLIDATANNSLLEAMASELPLIVTDVGGVRDYVDDASAFILAERSAACAAHQIRWCIEHPEACEQKAQNARTRVLQSLTWPHVVQVMADRIDALEIPSTSSTAVQKMEFS